MLINKKTLEKLRLIINEETEYRSGPQLVSFFNELGFNDRYGQGFPSRWVYTDNKLEAINGTADIDKCIRKVLAPINFVGNINKLDEIIKDFNQYLSFDNWKVVRRGKEIQFEKTDNIDWLTESKDETDFLEKEFDGINFSSLSLDQRTEKVLMTRIDEIEKCLRCKAPLASIFLSGSTLEGILLNLAINKPKEFNQSLCAPKNKEGKVKKFYNWTLRELIDVAYDVGVLKEDVKKFGHFLRDFRNYIHPYQQMSSDFFPDEYTAKICFQVLKAAIYQINNYTI